MPAARVAAEIVKTEADRIRIAAATERLDRKVEELGRSSGMTCPRGRRLVKWRSISPNKKPPNIFHYRPGLQSREPQSQNQIIMCRAVTLASITSRER